MALPEYNGDWVPDWVNDSKIYTISRIIIEIAKEWTNTCYNPIAFKSEEIRDKFLDNNLDLLKEYFELD